MALEKMNEVLGQVDFFQSFSQDQINLVAFVSDFRHVKEGDLLITEGQVAEGAFILVSGRLVAEHEGGKPAGPIVDQSGALVGEMALLAEMPRGTSVRALSDSEVVFVPRTHFKKLIQTYPELGDIMADHIRQSLSRYVGNLTSVRAKLKIG